MNAFTILFFSFFTTLIHAAPLELRDVVSPPILTPTAGTVWNVGETQTVTWNTSSIPAQQSNPVGELVLGYLENNSENLNLDNPLASNILLTNGQVQITVPNVPPRTDYIVCLIGDSGNISPLFTINGGTSSSSGSTSASSSTSGSPTAPTTTVTSTGVSQTVITSVGATTVVKASIISTATAPSSSSPTSASTMLSPPDAGTSSSVSAAPARTSTSAAWRMCSFDGLKLYSFGVSALTLFALL